MSSKYSSPAQFDHSSLTGASSQVGFCGVDPIIDIDPLIRRCEPLVALARTHRWLVIFGLLTTMPAWGPLFAH